MPCPTAVRLTLRSFDADRDGNAGISIDVADTGIGMSADIMDKVFDPFFTSKRQEGTGLGLSISQTLMKRQRGQITVESRDRLAEAHSAYGCRRRELTGHFVQGAVRTFCPWLSGDPSTSD